MRSISFGRRQPQPQGGDAAGVADAVEPSPPDNDRTTREAVKERLRAMVMERIDPSIAGQVPGHVLRAEIADLVGEIATIERIRLNEFEESELAVELADDMIGLGPIQPFLDDDAITDILVNGPYDVYVERAGKLVKTAARFRDAQHVANVAQRIATAVGRRIDEASPMVDARLGDGSRVNIVLPPLALNGGSISIRKFSRNKITLEVMAEQGNLSPQMATFLHIAGHCRANILVSGGTGSGKTTLLNAISQAIDPDERIITIEDAAELRLQQPHVVPLETRAANIEGIGAVAQRELVRNALRMRPDRIIVGEVRGAEAYDMLQAMNTGHDGSMSTIHANNPRDALHRLENMVLMATANLPARSVRAQIASAINLVVHVERMRDGVRRVQNIVEVVGMEGEVMTLRDLFAFRYTGDEASRVVDGVFESNRMRPNLVARANHFGLEREMLTALGIAGA